MHPGERAAKAKDRVTVALYPARFLPHLPAPWRLRLRFGEVVIDCTSADFEPRGWCRMETLYVLIAALEGRIGPMQAAAAASGRTRRAVEKPATWDQVSGGLSELHLTETKGTVGAALRMVGADLLGEWSGDAAETTRGTDAPPKTKRRRSSR